MNRSLRSIPSLVCLFTAATLLISSNAFARTKTTTPTTAANLEQCANGPATAPTPCNVASKKAGYTRGNISETSAHYTEGESLPVRIVLSNLIVGKTYTATVGYNLTDDGRYAIDYLTSFDRTETLGAGNDPCVNVGGCSLGSFSTFPIPVDPEVTAGFDGAFSSGDDITQIPGVFTLFGGTLTGVSSYSRVGATTGDSFKTIVLWFTADQSNLAIAYGAHVATRDDWGFTHTAVDAQGIRYLNSVADVSSVTGGNRNVGMAIATPTVVPASITIIKQAAPESAQVFDFTASGPGVSNFSLVDDGVDNDSTPNSITFSGLTAFGAGNPVTITEDLGTTGTYALVGLNCSSYPNGGSGVNNNTTNVPAGYVSIVLEEAESVVCTFNNAVGTN